MSPRPGAAGALLALCLLPAAPANAAGGGLDLGASLRSVAAVLWYPPEPLLYGEGNSRDAVSQTTLRLTSEGEAAPRVSFQGHLVGALTWSDGEGSLGAVAGFGGADRYRAADLTWDGGGGDGRLRARVDRLNVRIAWPALDVTIGRQAINFSQAYFWNPLDVFLPFDPEAFDRSYKPGVDALRADLPLGPFSGLSLVAAAGRELEPAPGVAKARPFADDPWFGSALLLRGRTNLRNWDAAAQAGAVYGGWQAGAAFSGEIGELGLRGEAARFVPRGKREIRLTDGRERALLPAHWAAVVGADHRFESSLYVNVEYLCNGAGGDLDAAAARAAAGGSLGLGRHLLGAEISYDFHPLLATHLSGVRSLSDGSTLLSPTAAWSLSNDSEIIFGAFLTFGARPVERTPPEGGEPFLHLVSEYGASPDALFAQYTVYF